MTTVREKTCIQNYATGFLLIFFIKGKGWHQLFTIKISYTHMHMIDTYCHFCTTNNLFHKGFLKTIFHWLDKCCFMYMRDTYGEHLVQKCRCQASFEMNCVNSALLITVSKQVSWTPSASPTPNKSYRPSWHSQMIASKSHSGNVFVVLIQENFFKRIVSIVLFCLAFSFLWGQSLSARFF